MNSIKRTFWTAAGLLGLAAILALPAAADQQILDDLIVVGSACIGQDCVNGESFGFDTLRLKENNLRLHFQDTSTSASFPTNDWRIVANDSSNGGGNYLAIEDSNAGRQPFRVEAGARANALYVEDDGDIGLGTSTPVVNLHIKDGNTPTLRLEQDGTSGFAAQTWDLAGNEANFFIRDASNGSTLPFRIFPAAPSNALTIEASTGDIGLNTTNPTEELHVFSTAADGTRILIQNNNGAATPSGFDLQNSFPRIWRISNSASGQLVFRNQEGALNAFILEDTGKLTITGAIITGGPTCVAPGGCDDVFSPDYEVESIQDHASAMWRNQHLPAVGPTSPDRPFNVTEKSGGMLNELEKAHIYIEQLHGRLAKVEALLAASEAGKSVE